MCYPNNYNYVTRAVCSDEQENILQKYVWELETTQTRYDHNLSRKSVYLFNNFHIFGCVWTFAETLKSFEKLLLCTI